MKKRIFTILMVALVLAIAAASFTGCFFQNLSFISGTMTGESAEALENFNQDPYEEDENGNIKITLSNFTQLNKVSLSMGADNAMAVVEYKFTENGFSYSVYTETNAAGVYSSSGRSDIYVEKDGDYWFAYIANPSNPSEWRVGAIETSTVKAYLEAKSNNSPADTRANLFDAKNYKSSGDHYEYVGPKVYLTIAGGSSADMTFNMNVDGLFNVEKGVEIKGNVEYDMTAEQKAAAAAAGYSMDMPFSYSILNVGTTKITFPTVQNSDYKAQYKAMKERQNAANSNNDNDNEDNGENDNGGEKE